VLEDRPALEIKTKKRKKQLEESSGKMKK